MRSRVHRSGQQLLEALKQGTGGYYAAFGRSRIDPGLLRRIESTARTHDHRNVSAAPELWPGATQLIQRFFEFAARSDPDWCYAFSSGVLLAIPEYPDLALIFLLRALESSESDASVDVWVDDDWLARLIEYELHGGRRPVFRGTLSRALMRGARSVMRHAFAPAPPDKCEVLLFTLGDNAVRGESDAYFGDLARALAYKRNVLTVFAAAGAQLRFPRRARAAPLEAFMSPTDAIRAWSRSRPRHEGADPGVTSFDASLLAYLRARERGAGELFMQRLMAEAFDRMLAHLRPQVVVYPFENRSWEKNLVRAARRNAVRCIGYQHSSITPRHLAFTAGRQHRNDDLPDRILTCGEITAKIVAQSLPKNSPSITVGAALRAQRLDVAAPSTWGILVPMSSSRAEAWEILSLLNEAAPLLKMPVKVRTHPTIPVDDLFAQFRWPANVTLSRGRTLAQDLAETALIAYSSSTVALEGMLYGRLPCYLEIGDVPSGDPIGGAFDFVFRAASGAELAEVVSHVQSMPDSRIEVLRGQARAYAEQYLIEPTPRNVERMADLIAG